LKSILFDLDGTIIDSTNAIVEGFNVACKQENLKNLKLNLVTSLIGYPLWDMFEKINVPKNKINNCIDNYKVHYRKISHKQTTLIKNAKESLILAKSFAKTCAVTTKIGKGSIALLETLDIWQYFDDIVGFDDVSKPKPDKESMVLAMKKLNSIKEKTWMIGDTHMDMQSAKSAGIGAIGVLSGYQDENDLKAWSNIIKIDSLEAVKYIKTIS
jgi:phosphoglycolate phosphatase